MEKELLQAIGLALSSSHNCIATDDVEAKTDEKSWRIDHSKEIQAVEKLAEVLSKCDAVIEYMEKNDIDQYTLLNYMECNPSVM